MDTNRPPGRLPTHLKGYIRIVGLSVLVVVLMGLALVDGTIAALGLWSGLGLPVSRKRETLDIALDDRYRQADPQTWLMSSDLTYDSAVWVAWAKDGALDYGIPSPWWSEFPVSVMTGRIHISSIEGRTHFRSIQVIRLWPLLFIAALGTELHAVSGLPWVMCLLPEFPGMFLYWSPIRVASNIYEELTANIAKLHMLHSPH